VRPDRLTALLLRLTVVVVGLLLLLLAAGGGQAKAPFDPNGFRFDSPFYTVHESDGHAVITVVRANVLQGAQVRYITSGEGYDPWINAPFPCGPGPCTAIDPYDFHSVRGELDFQAGQASAQFTVPVVDHGTASVPKTFQVALFGPATYPGQIGLANPSTATVTILEDDPDAPRDPLNPLGLATPPPPGNPLGGARFFVDHKSAVAQAARRHHALGVIARQPGAARFGSFSFTSPYVPDIGIAVSRYLTRAAATEPGTVPQLATYRIAYGHCGHWSDPPSEQAAYHNFITGLAQGIGTYPAVLFLEMDSIITSPCLSGQGLAVRMAELRDAINVLTSTDPHIVIYLDAGAADAIHARDAANLLNRAGVAKIQGFFLNSTHFDWTLKEIRYGEAISRMTGGKHFVVNTGEGGQGPLIPRDRVHQGNEVLCNPPGRGLGPKPTTHTRFRNVDAFLWTSNPGESGGKCVPGAPPTGAYWPAYGLMLVRHANFHVH